MQQSGIGSNEYDRPRNADLLIMTDNLSDNESDSDMLTSITKVSLLENIFCSKKNSYNRRYHAFLTSFSSHDVNQILR